MRWEDVLQDDEIHYGDFELHASGTTYRGPIATLSIQDGIMCVVMHWCAYKADTGNDSLVGPWFVWPIATLRYCVAGIIPSRVGLNIVFDLKPIGRGLLIPRDGTTLNWERIQPAPLRR